MFRCLVVKITTISDLLLVKSAKFIGKTGHRFRCLDIAAIFVYAAGSKVSGEALPDISNAALDF